MRERDARSASDVPKATGAGTSGAGTSGVGTSGAGTSGAAAALPRLDLGRQPDAAPPSSGGGQPLAPGVRSDMEHAFGADFSAVRIHEGDQAPALGALAYTQGADIHFARGQYATDTTAGRNLLGHELAHVVQQAEGRVAATTQAKGVAINDDDALEHEADDKGARAARGERVAGASGTVVAGASASAGSVQRYAFVGGKQVTKAAGLSADKQSFVTDTVVRSYDTDAEFTKHAARATDYLGNLKDGTWVRFNPTGINLLGEDHTLVTLDQVAPAVNSTSFIYEPFSADDLSSSPAMKAAYETENADRFKTMGVDGLADKKQVGAESLYPKIGYGMVAGLPFSRGRNAQALDQGDRRSEEGAGEPGRCLREGQPRRSRVPERPGEAEGRCASHVLGASRQARSRERAPHDRGVRLGSHVRR
jgi:hypothetical protein